MTETTRIVVTEGDMESALSFLHRVDAEARFNDAGDEVFNELYDKFVEADWLGGYVEKLYIVELYEKLIGYIRTVIAVSDVVEKLASQLREYSQATGSATFGASVEYHSDKIVENLFSERALELYLEKVEEELASIQEKK